MPDVRRTGKAKQETRDRKHVTKVSSLKFLVSGFSLIEILLAMFFIAAIVTILLTTSGSLFTRRKSDQQAIASKAASKEIERLRGLTYDNLLAQTPPDYVWGSSPVCQNPWPAPDPNNDLKYLRDGKLCRNLYDYGNGGIGTNPTPSGANKTKIVGVQITIHWNNDQGANQSLTMDTLISENGL